MSIRAASSLTAVSPALVLPIGQRDPERLVHEAGEWTSQMSPEPALDVPVRSQSIRGGQAPLQKSAVDAISLRQRVTNHVKGTLYDLQNLEHLHVQGGTLERVKYAFTRDGRMWTWGGILLAIVIAGLIVAAIALCCSAKRGRSSADNQRQYLTTKRNIFQGGQYDANYDLESQHWFGAGGGGGGHFHGGETRPRLNFKD